MKPEELRIGNWVKYRGEPAKVEQLRVNCLGIANSDVLVDYNEIEPIELTEEVLLKIGFYKKSIGDELYRYYKEVCIDNYNYLFDFAVIPKDEYAGLKVTRAENEDDEDDYYSAIFYNDNIKYLHELQNAYYLMANKELKIEL